MSGTRTPFFMLSDDAKCIGMDPRTILTERLSQLAVIEVSVWNLLFFFWLGDDALMIRSRIVEA